VIQVGQSLSSFPLAEGAGTPKDAEQEQRGAWRREMERAQLAAWLSHGIVGGGPMAPLPVTRWPAAAISNAGAGASTPDAATATRTRATADTVSSAGRADDIRITSATDGFEQAQSGAATEGDLATTNDAEDTGRWRGDLIAGPRAQGAAGVQSIATDADGTAPAKNSADPLAYGNGASRLLAEVNAALVEIQADRAALKVPELQVLADASMAKTSAARVGLALNDSALRAGFAGRAEETQLTGGAARVAPLQRRGRPQAASVREPVRVHAEWTADGVRVWLGLDATALAHQKAIAQQVRRWVAAQNARVLSLSCNGRSLATSDASDGPMQDSINDQPIHVKEQPWPSVR
jgi:hypothetical protein